MFVQSRAMGLNLYRNLDLHNKNASMALRRLSSGTRINSAADDAAGLGISERMKAQLRMISVEQTKAADQIFAYQTQDAALGQVQSMMNRMLELSTQATNGTYSDSDRKTMNAEYQQLLEEVEGVLAEVHFEPQNLFENKIPEVKMDREEGGEPLIAGSASSKVYRTNDIAAFLDGLNGFLDSVAYSKDLDTALNQGIEFDCRANNSESLRSAAAVYITENAEQLFGDKEGTGAFTITVSGDNVSIEMARSTTEKLGLKGTNLLDDKSASGAMEALKTAIDIISEQRGSLGAMANRMKYTKARLEQMEINLTDSLSRITDTDMAHEMMVMNRSQMLSQVGVYLMSQYKMQSGAVLKLIAD